MLVMPFLFSVAAQHTMMKKTMAMQVDAADQHVEPGVLVLFGADALFDEAGLQVEKLPGRDGGADERGEHQQIFGVEVQRGQRRFLWRRAASRAWRAPPKRRRRDRSRRPPGIFFPPGGSSPSPPAARRRARERHGDVFADAENLHGRGDAGEFRHGVAQIHGERGDHHEESGAEAEFFADQVGEAFAGDDAHARAHFFADVERDGHGDQRPEQGVAELRAGRACRW